MLEAAFIEKEKKKKHFSRYRKKREEEKQKQKKRKRGLKRVPSETAQKHFLRRNGLRNREAIEAKHFLSPREKKKKKKK